MESKIVPAEAGRGRKKIGNPEAWKKNTEKRARHMAKGLPSYPKCDHNGKTYKCRNLTMCDIREFHDNFYKCSTKIEQDRFILKYLKSCKPARERVKVDGSSRKQIVMKYFIRKANCKTFEIQVCQQTFLNVLNISKDRVQRIGRNHYRTGEMPRENRGGDRRSQKFLTKKEAVRNFIESLNCVESHYCRGKSMGRQYLPCNLNISKIFKMYNNSVPDEQLKVKKTFFRNIFNRSYNIGFGSPVTDACSKCLKYKEMIKQEKDVAKKYAIMALQRLHKLRAKAFFEKLKETKEDMITFSFDCQKNLVNPKVPDQAAYYSRQLYTYNFTIVMGSSKSKMSLSNVFIYTWMENEFSKGSNEISSAVFDRLSKTDLTPFKVIRLCADGCGGQNRNSTMIGMCSYFLANVAPANIKTIELVFPTPGHSFLPPDRVFGRIEKVLKKEVTIANPDRYFTIFKDHGTTSRLGVDCLVKDWKSEATQYFKAVGSWHFKFSEMKRFVLTKNPTKKTISLRGEIYYNSDTGVPKSVMKKGKVITHFSPRILKLGAVAVKPAKLVDVKKLLTIHFGSDWHKQEELQFYRNLLMKNGEDPEIPLGILDPENNTLENEEPQAGTVGQDDFCEVRDEKLLENTEDFRI